MFFSVLFLLLSIAFAFLNAKTLASTSLLIAVVQYIRSAILHEGDFSLLVQEQEEKGDDVVEEIEEVEESKIPDHNYYPHVLLYGMPGLGKTSIARILAAYLEKLYGHPIQTFYLTPANLRSKKDLDEIFLNLKPYAFIMIDEIHRLRHDLAEAIFGAMQDGVYSVSGREEMALGDIIIGTERGMGFEINLPPFTLVGATTDRGLLPKPLEDRFRITLELHPYSVEEIVQILRNYVSGFKAKSFKTYVGQKQVKKVLMLHLKAMGLGDPGKIELDKQENQTNLKFSNEALESIARRSFSIPRVGIKYLEHVLAYVKAYEIKYVKKKHVDDAMHILGVDENGLTEEHLRTIKVLMARDNKPLGTKALSEAIHSSKIDVEERIVPQLTLAGFMTRDNRSMKMLTTKAYEYYGNIAS